ncbi:MAG: nucleotidyl transferase AbiEii/AbiGii toxin family protein [Porphyromonadaceae bacterium]|nr:nucleotidyl transferase AbiEii/AbiGii toxin family protein [Porphyromonadaceae bacterium]
MLHTQALKGETFKLLKTLMNDSRLKDFNLAGGTALAFYLGHRLSVDLDLFTPNPFDAKKMEEYLIEKYDFKSDYFEKNTLKGTIAGVKIDCITYSYPNIENPYISQEDIRLYSMKDIVAMKLSAIADDGSRLKDFVDIACLSTQMTFNQMLQSYTEKYPNANPVRPLKGLLYFEDINFEEPIFILKGKYSWKNIQKRLEQMQKKRDVLFEKMPL